jgi:uncharacterized protein (DUF1778 family)
VMAGYPTRYQCSYIVAFGSLHEAFGMPFSLRLNDEKMVAITAAAAAAGLSRARWFERLADRELAETAGLQTSRQAAEPNTSRSQISVHVRLRPAEVAAVDRVAAATGRSRMEWIRQRIQGGVASDIDAVPPAPAITAELLAMRKQLSGLASNANQFAKALNTALMIESGVGLRTATVGFEKALAEALDYLREAKSELRALADGEREYWTK